MDYDTWLQSDEAFDKHHWLGRYSAEEEKKRHERKEKKAERKIDESKEKGWK